MAQEFLAFRGKHKTWHCLTVKEHVQANAVSNVNMYDTVQQVSSSQFVARYRCRYLLSESGRMPFCLFTRAPTYLPTYLPTCIPTYPPRTDPPTYLSTYLLTYISSYLSLHVLNFKWPPAVCLSGGSGQLQALAKHLWCHNIKGQLGGSAAPYTCREDSTQ